MNDKIQGARERRDTLDDGGCIKPEWTISINIYILGIYWPCICALAHAVVDYNVLLEL